MSSSEPHSWIASDSIVKEFGSRRDLDWVSIDPLVPLGEHASDSVLGGTVPARLIERGCTEAVFGGSLLRFST
jgi:hypothetical protein